VTAKKKVATKQLEKKEGKVRKKKKPTAFKKEVCDQKKHKIGEKKKVGGPKGKATGGTPGGRVTSSLAARKLGPGVGGKKKEKKKRLPTAEE